MKPNFIIAGVAKCGTTSLSEYLEQHPQVCIPKKETFYFIRDLYEQEPVDPRGRRKAEQIIRNSSDYYQLYSKCHTPFLGEVSTCYLYYHKKAIPAILKELGDIPVAIIIRQPVKRLISGYRHFIRLQREDKPLSEALQLEKERAASGWDFMWQYRDLGLYAEGIKAYQQHFSKVKVILQDDLTKSPVSVMQDLFRFFGMDDSFVPDTSVKYNISDSQSNNFWFRYIFQNEKVKKVLKPVANIFMDERKRRKFIHRFRKSAVKTEEKFELAPQLIEELNNYYHQDILETQKLTGLDLSHWLK